LRKIIKNNPKYGGGEVVPTNAPTKTNKSTNVEKARL
jgi:hypothetical protein